MRISLEKKKEKKIISHDRVNYIPTMYDPYIRRYDMEIKNK